MSLGTGSVVLFVAGLSAGFLRRELMLGVLLFALGAIGIEAVVYLLGP